MTTQDAPQGLIDTVRNWFASQANTDADAPAPEPQAQSAAPPPPSNPPSERPRDEQGRFVAASQANAPADDAPLVTFTAEQVQALIAAGVAPPKPQSTEEQVLALRRAPPETQAPTPAAFATPTGPTRAEQWDASNIHRAPRDVQDKWVESGGFQAACLDPNSQWFTRQ